MFRKRREKLCRKSYDKLIVNQARIVKGNNCLKDPQKDNEHRTIFKGVIIDNVGDPWSGPLSSNISSFCRN